VASPRLTGSTLTAFITSRYTLDKKDEYRRRHLDEHAAFLGAIRLPGGKDGAFAQNAGTEVTADIIFLRKRMEDETGSVSPAWLETSETSVPNEDNLFQDAAINQYFLDNPHMVLGQLALAGSMYRENELTVLGHLTDELLDSAIQNLPENVIRYDASIREIEPDQVLRLSNSTHRIKNNAFDIVEGSIVVRNGDALMRPDFSPVSRQRIHKFIQLRDTLRGLYNAQLQDLDEGIIADKRARLNSQYEMFLAVFGPLHAPANVKLLSNDPDFPVVLAIEDYNPSTHEAPLTCSIYEDIRSKLVRRGVPAGEIRFIHEAKTDADKIALFGQMNRGEVRILLGSTEKMGTGANIQNRLLALHHLDCPWRPSDLEQRNGRIHRQGNENAEIMIFGYISQGSFDGYMWQGVGNKAKFIAQAMSGDLSIREIEDADAMVLTAAEATALSSDDPLIRERINVEIEVRRLLGLQAAHSDQQHYDRSKLLNLRSSLIYRQRKLAFERGLLEEKQRWIAANPDLAPIDLPGVPEPKAIDIIRATKNQPEGGCVAHYGPFAVTVSKPGRYSRLTTDFGESPEFDAHFPDITSSGSVLGTLIRHWNSIGSTISMDETQIDGMIRTIESLEASLASKAFPHQEQLDTKRARLKELDEHFKTIAAAEGGLGEDADLDTEEAA